MGLQQHLFLESEVAAVGGQRVIMSICRAYRGILEFPQPKGQQKPVKFPRHFDGRCPVKEIRLRLLHCSRPLHQWPLKTRVWIGSTSA
jgi:hypothetical protein